MFDDFLNLLKKQGFSRLSDRISILDAERLTTQFRVVSIKKYPPAVSNEGPETIIHATRLVMEKGKNGLYSINQFSYKSSEYSGTQASNPNSLGRKLKAIWSGGYPDGEYTREQAIKIMQKFDRQYPEVHDAEDLRGIRLYTERIVPAYKK